MNPNRQPWTWLLWHPHQGLANASLVRTLTQRVRPKVLGKALVRLVIHADTALLTLRAVARRLRIAGPARLFGASSPPAGREIVYLDLGTHREGCELALMVNDFLPALGLPFRAYGFEASGPSFESVSRRFSDRPNVSLHHAALCHDVPAGGKLTLYKADDSLSDSLYRPTETSEDVDALRLSDFLRDHEPKLLNKIVLLRMNIEGAEADVVHDLVESGIADHVAGWFGMWDDLSKIDPERDASFRIFLEEHHIRTTTFNGRDLAWPSRLRVIRYELRTALLGAGTEAPDGVETHGSDRT